MQITFHGGTREIGGSCIDVKTKYAKISLDYGVKVGEDEDFILPKDLDVAIISHAHLDHSGNLLHLSDTDVPVIGSKATRDVSAELLLDSIKIHRMNGRATTHSRKDVNRIRDLWWDRKTVALPGMEIRLYPAGHVLGSNMIEVKSEDKTLLYTGDFCLHDSEIIDGASMEKLPKEPDALIMESTYGGKTRSKTSVFTNRFFKILLKTMERGGNVLIPAFAFHRSQEIAKRIDRAMKLKKIPRYNVYYISELARRIGEYFNQHKDLLKNQIQKEERPFNYKYVKHLRRTKQLSDPAIVVCTSGFGHAGASRRLLAEWASDERNSILITSGYLPPDSPLTAAKERREIFENGKKIVVNADVEHVEFSGHADQKELIKLVKTLKPKQTFLVHGDLEQETALSKEIAEITCVEMPEKLDSFLI
jgi:Cft2 family RNA processing exonuclease